MVQPPCFYLPKVALSIAFLVSFLSDLGSSFTIHTEITKPCNPLNARSNGSRILYTPNYHPLSYRARSNLALGATTASDSVLERDRRTLDAKQLDFVLGYLNKHHSDVLTKFAETFSELGIEKAKKNAWSGNAYSILSAKIVGIDTKSFQLEVEVKQRREGTITKEVEVDLGESIISVGKARKANFKNETVLDGAKFTIAFVFHPSHTYIRN